MVDSAQDPPKTFGKLEYLIIILFLTHCFRVSGSLPSQENGPRQWRGHICGAGRGIRLQQQRRPDPQCLVQRGPGGSHRVLRHLCEGLPVQTPRRRYSVLSYARVYQLNIF